MPELSLASVTFYCLFSMFVFYQQLHFKNFQGAWQSFHIALGISVFIGMLTGLSYLVYYGWLVVWWAPFLIFIIGLAATILGVIVERIVGSLALSLGGFIGWPLSAYFMFHYIPRKL